MKIFYIILAIWIMFGLYENATCQDIHFSQSDAVQILNNPAMTGIFYGDHRVVLNYRDQWNSIANPYKTMAVQYDGTFFKNKLKFKDKVGLGITAYNDRAGDGNMGINQITLLGSYYKSLTMSQGLCLGFSGGYAQHTLDKNNLTWGNQYDGNYNPSLPTGEEAVSYQNNYSYIDIGTGLLWDYRKDKYFAANFGASLQHANLIKLTFVNATDQNLYRKFTIHSTLEKKIKNTETTFYPSFIYRIQGQNQEFIYGCNIKYQLREDGNVRGNLLETALNVGIYHRYGDAFIFVTKFSYMHFTLGISYDVNESKLADATHYKGGLEFSLVYITPYVKRNKGNTLL